MTPTPIDTRPANCRHRLQDEGKAYPRSSCTHCGKTVTTGLGKSCTLGMVGGYEGIKDDFDATEKLKASGFTFVAAPLPAWGKVVAMTQHNGTIFVACEFMVARLEGNRLMPIMWVSGVER